MNCTHLKVFSLIICTVNLVIYFKRSNDLPVLQSVHRQRSVCISVCVLGIMFTLEDRSSVLLNRSTRLQFEKIIFSRSREMYTYQTVGWCSTWQREQGSNGPSGPHLFLPEWFYHWAVWSRACWRKDAEGCKTQVIDSLAKGEFK